MNSSAAYKELSTKSDIYIINVVNQEKQNSKENYEAAKIIFEERNLSVERAKDILADRKAMTTELRPLMRQGLPREVLIDKIIANSIPRHDADMYLAKIYTNYETELVEDYNDRKRYFLYAFFWIIGFSIISVILFSRFLGDATLMLNLLLIFPFLYLRFKPLPKLMALRNANNTFGYC